MPDSLPAPTGRPLEYTDAVAETICLLLREGHSLRAICEREGFPAPSTVYHWLEVNERFREQYARARDKQADTYADRIGDVGERLLRGELDPNAARVAIDALKWTASKLAPKKYGDRVDQGNGPQITVLISRDNAMIDVTPAPAVDRITDRSEDS